MPQITQEILQRNFQKIAPRVAEILADEIVYQGAITYDTDLEKLVVFIERADPFNHTETLCINVALAQGDFERKHQGSKDGMYLYNIDFYGNKKTTADKRGDESAALIVQKLFGLADSILENPIYNTLGYEKGFIGGTLVQKIQIADPEDKDTKSNYMARLTLAVRLTETTSYKEGKLIAGYETTMKISTSDQGYQWIGETYGG